MAKISSLVLVLFSMALAVPLRSVMCQDGSWQSLISQAGITQDAIFEAQKAVSDGSAQKAAEDAIGDASLGDLVQTANDMGLTNGSPPPTAESNSPAEAPEDSPEDELQDSPAEAPEGKSPTEAPMEAPELAPKNAPTEAPERAPKHAPTEAPSAAPKAQAPSAATPQSQAPWAA